MKNFRKSKKRKDLNEIATPFLRRGLAMTCQNHTPSEEYPLKGYCFGKDFESCSVIAVMIARKIKLGKRCIGCDQLSMVLLNDREEEITLQDQKVFAILLAAKSMKIGFSWNSVRS